MIPMSMGKIAQKLRAKERWISQLRDCLIWPELAACSCLLNCPGAVEERLTVGGAGFSMTGGGPGH